MNLYEFTSQQLASVVGKATYFVVKVASKQRAELVLIAIRLPEKLPTSSLKTVFLFDLEPNQLMTFF